MGSLLLQYHTTVAYRNEAYCDGDYYAYDSTCLRCAHHYYL